MQLGLRPDTARQTIAECAIREAAEETGLRLRNDTSQAACRTLLAQPQAFTCAEVIRRDPTSMLIQYHYVLVEVRTVQTHGAASDSTALASVSLVYGSEG